MVEPRLSSVRAALQGELRFRPALTIDTVRALLVAFSDPSRSVDAPRFFWACSPLSRDASRLLRDLSGRGDPRKGGGLLSLEERETHPDPLARLTAEGVALCDRLDRSCPAPEGRPGAGVMGLLSGFRDAVPGGCLRDLILLIELEEARARGDGRPFRIRKSGLQRLRDASLVGWSEPGRRRGYQPPPLTDAGRELLARLAECRPSFDRRSVALIDLD